MCVFLLYWHIYSVGGIFGYLLRVLNDSVNVASSKIIGPRGRRRVISLISAFNFGLSLGLRLGQSGNVTNGVLKEPCN